MPCVKSHTEEDFRVRFVSGHGNSFLRDSFPFEYILLMSNGVVMTLEQIMKSLALSTCSSRYQCHSITVTNQPISHQLDFYPLLPWLPVSHKGVLESDAIPEPFLNLMLAHCIPILISHIHKEEPEIQKMCECQFISMFVNLLVMLW